MMLTEINESEIDFSEGLLINELAAWMDGGTITFYCETSTVKEIVIEVVQRMQLMKRENAKYPGALYLHHQLVGLRSPLEQAMIVGLKKASFENKAKTSAIDRNILAEIIEYLESDALIETAYKTGRINHISNDILPKKK